MLASRLNIAQRTRPFKLVMVTSALPGEGKSTIAANLASFLAASGQRVFLVDANLNSPALAEYFQIYSHPGLVDVLMEASAEVDWNLYCQPTDIPNLSVLAAGVPTFIPSDLRGPSQIGRLFEHFAKAPFDYIILDTPPLLPAADTQVWALYTQTMIVVVDAYKTPRRVLLRLKQTLTLTHSMVLGAVINKSRWPEGNEMRQYVSKLRQRRAYNTASMGSPLTEAPVAKHADTPLMNGREELEDVTITLHRQRQVKDDQS
jgi:capsular exopolysaccharide synthesis family protein